MRARTLRSTKTATGGPVCLHMPEGFVDVMTRLRAGAHRRRWLAATTTGLALALAAIGPGAALAAGFPPFAFNDSVDTNEDTADTGNVLDNDFNFNTTPMSVTGSRRSTRRSACS